MLTDLAGGFFFPNRSMRLSLPDKCSNEYQLVQAINVNVQQGVVPSSQSFIYIKEQEEKRKN